MDELLSTLDLIMLFFPCNCGNLICHNDRKNLLQCGTCGALYLRGLSGEWFRVIPVIFEFEIDLNGKDDDNDEDL